MIEGFTVKNRHTWRHFRLRVLSRRIGAAPKDDHTERAPYSNLTADYDEVYGGASYGERKLNYMLEFLCSDKHLAQTQLVAILRFFHWTGRADLYDDLLPDYHFEVREPAVEFEEDHGVYTISMVFPASPGIVPNVIRRYTVDDVHYPDVNGDGRVNANDAAMILTAAANIGAKRPSGLTPEQEKLADADMDGRITANDAALVERFAAACGARQAENTPEGWAAYLSATIRQEESLY